MGAKEDKDMWGALGRFALKLGTGDVIGAAEVLKEEAAVAHVETKEDDPPCNRREDNLVCLGHGFGGACVMGVPHAVPVEKKSEPKVKE
jgi:hypothetical protein